MRILSITAQKPHSTGSGVYLTGLVKGFAALGQEQAVVAGVYQDDLLHFPEGTRVYPVYFQSGQLPFAIAGMSDEMPYESTIYSQMTDSMAEAFRTAFLERIGQAAEEFSPDLILCHHLYLLTSIVREAFPHHRVAGICHGTGLRQMKKNGLWREYIRENIQKLDQIFCLHQEQMEEVARVYGADREKIELLGAGYDDSIFHILPDIGNCTCGTKPGEEEETKQLQKREKRLIYAGKLSEKKGVMSLLRSMSHIREQNLTLWLAGGWGNKEEYSEICQLASSCPYPVEFLGRLSQEELARKMNEADVFVLPSFYEGLPLVVVEALACGLRVVCSDLPGVRPWILEKIGKCPVEFVALPSIIHTDEPVKEELPEFERRLAEAVERSLDSTEQPDLSKVALLSWTGISRRILEVCEKEN